MGCPVSSRTDSHAGRFIHRLLNPPLPPYRHRPGLTPHPERDPAGHRFLESLPPGLLPATRAPLAALPESPLFGYGERLFRAGYYWEAHAVWEELWNAVRRDPASPGEETAAGEALRGFIQLAAAALKRELENPAGSRKLLAAAEGSLARAGTGAVALARRFRALRSTAGLAS